jgi:hypothetical protein
MIGILFGLAMISSSVAMPMINSAHVTGDPPRPKDASPMLRSLSPAELKERLKEATIRRVLPIGVESSDPGVEEFAADGNYVRHFDRVKVRGSFNVTGDLVCTSLEGRRRCRKAFVDSTGYLYLMETDSGSVSKYEIAPMR